MRRFRLTKRCLALTLAASAFLGVDLAMPSSAATGQPEHLLITIDMIGNTQTFEATGPASGNGTVSSINSPSRGRRNSGVSEFLFSAGASSGSSFTVSHTGRSTRPHVNRRTCTVAYKEYGTFKVTAATGSLSGLSGSGHYKGSGASTYSTRGGCNPNANPITSVEVISATGTLQ
jgi:hypothetical protein